MGGKREIIVTVNTIQTWNLINVQYFLKIHALFDSQEVVTGWSKLKQLSTKIKLDRLNRPEK